MWLQMEYPGATESKHHKPILLPPENTRQQISTNAPPPPSLPAVLPGDPLQTLPEDKHFQSLTSDLAITSSSQQNTSWVFHHMAHVPKHSLPNGFVLLSAAFSSADVTLLLCPGATGAQSELCSISSSPASTEGIYGYTHLPDDAQTESHLLESHEGLRQNTAAQMWRFQMRQKNNTRLLVC